MVSIFFVIFQLISVVFSHREFYGTGKNYIIGVIGVIGVNEIWYDGTVKEMSEDKEAWSRLVMNNLLIETGWQLLDNENEKKNVICEATIRSKMGTKNSDYLLLDNYKKPLAVIETKAPEINPLSAKSQAKKYAVDIGARFIYLSNGKTHYFGIL